MSKFTVFFCLVVLSLRAHVLDVEAHNFGLSFINNYGFSVASRETREYHTCLLVHARENFKRLEQCLCDGGFQLQSRMVIMGYQEDAVPSYYTFDMRDRLDDEVTVATESGSACTARNVLGLATGFLLQDVNELCEGVFTHVLPERVGLFDERAQFFHRHAFGDAYAAMQQARKKIAQHLFAKDARGALNVLHNFWRYAYVHNVVDGGGAPLATQNVLFSLYYLQYLLNSSIPIEHVFIGPDITYPIELLPRQSLQATQGAQQFVQKFFAYLQPLNNESTAYVFASFIDGVGKSTLSGNIQNLLRHGTAFEKYDRVDNASSQRATLFPVTDKVVLVDLPAQMSHVTFKPDGAVYVPVDTVPELTANVIAAARAYAQENEDRLMDAFCDLVEQVDEGECGLTDPRAMYAYNVLLLSLDELVWIPFVFEGHQFLFNTDNKRELKILQPFAAVHSSGLKVKEPEQMLFTDGVSLPMSFEVFCDDLVNQLHEAHVKHVVFVDFLSMYPRTSRETIRVNFVIQQLKELCGDLFEIDKSLYKHFVQSYEPLVLMRKHTPELISALLLETCLRWALFDLIQQPGRKDVQSVVVDQVRLLVQKRFVHIYDEHKGDLLELIINKVTREQQEATAQFARDKTFEAITVFDVQAVVDFSQFLQRLFAWQHTTHDEYELLYDVSITCRDAVKLQELFATVRAHWYAALAQLIQPVEENTQVPPLLVRVQDDRLQVVCKKVSKARREPPFFPPEGLPKTNEGVYAFGYDPSVLTPLNAYVRSFVQRNPHKFMTTTQLYNYMKVAKLDERAEHGVQPAQLPALRLWVRAIATLELILKDVRAVVMARGNSKSDFVACMRLLENITLPHYFKVKVAQPLFDEYSTVSPVISWHPY